MKLFSVFPRVANILRTRTRVNRSSAGEKDQSFRGYIFIWLAATKRRTNNNLRDFSDIPVEQHERARKFSFRCRCGDTLNHPENPPAAVRTSTRHFSLINYRGNNSRGNRLEIHLSGADPKWKPSISVMERFEYFPANVAARINIRVTNEYKLQGMIY